MKELSAQVKGHFLRLYQMAMTDGDFSPTEWKFLYTYAEERGVSKSELDNILLNPTGPIAIPQTIEDKITYLYDFAQMILADGVITEDEKRTLNKYCTKFGFDPENVEELCDYLLDAASQDVKITELLNELI